MSRNVVSTPAATEESFDFLPWTIQTVKSHILPSKSTGNSPSKDRHAAFHDLSIPHLPDMVFPDNVLRIQLSNGSGIEFNALDALKLVNDKEDPVKVAIAEAWKESR
jgi:type 2A phosphatase activator TIP41